MEDADAASCQVAIALTGSDETNLIICEMCKDFFHVEKTVSFIRWELNLPKEIIIGCILRGDQSLIPRGDTSIKEGDILLMITSDKQKLNAVKELTKR